MIILKKAMNDLGVEGECNLLQVMGLWDQKGLASVTVWCLEGRFSTFNKD